MKLILAEGGATLRALVLASLAEAWPGLEAFTADGPESFARALETTACDLAIVDKSMPWCDADEAGRMLRARFPDCPMLMLSRDERTSAVVRAMRAGFDDYLPESAAGTGRLLAAARSLVEEGRERRRNAWTESRISELLARLDIGVYRATPGGILLFANAAFCRIFGLESWRDAPAWSLRPLLANPSDEARLARELERDGRLKAVELELKHPQGRERWISLSQCLRPAGPSIHFIEGWVEDITDRKRRNLEGRRREEDAHQQGRLEMVGHLAGGVAHDFNNLLTAINGFSDLMLEKMSVDDPQRCNIAEIRAAGSRAALLTRQLLAFSCRLMLHPRRLDLVAFLGSLRHRLHESLGPAIHLRILHGPEIPPIHADPDQLESVVTCLTDNAKEAMDGGGTLTLRTYRLKVTEEGEDEAPRGGHRERLQPGEYAVLAVEDTGRGIDRETLGRIFEPYFTTKPGLPGKSKSGKGLGLSIAYGVLKQSRGAIDVESCPGQGTRVRLYLPLAEDRSGAEIPGGYAGEKAGKRAGNLPPDWRD